MRVQWRILKSKKKKLFSFSFSIFLSLPNVFCLLLTSPDLTSNIFFFWGVLWGFSHLSSSFSLPFFRVYYIQQTQTYLSITNPNKSTEAAREKEEKGTLFEFTKQHCHKSNENSLFFQFSLSIQKEKLIEKERERMNASNE